MAIKLKAKETLQRIGDYAGTYRFVLNTELYNRLSESKVIQEAALRSGVSRGVMQACWDAAGEVIKAWATEGHSVALPGLGTMRFGVRAKSVDSVDKVASSLITTRRVIFTPNVEIKNELKSTAINITCYDRNGQVIKNVTSGDDGDIEDPDNEGGGDDNPGGGSGSGGDNEGGNSGNQSRQFTITVNSANTEMGTVTGGGTFSEGSVIQISASPKIGNQFEKWSDGVTTPNRNITVTQNLTLTAQFVADENPGDGGGGDNPGDYD